jgi:hypothetical protein
MIQEFLPIDGVTLKPLDPAANLVVLDKLPNPFERAPSQFRSLAGSQLRRLEQHIAIRSLRGKVDVALYDRRHIKDSTLVDFK